MKLSGNYEQFYDGFPFRGRLGKPLQGLITTLSMAKATKMITGTEMAGVDSFVVLFSGEEEEEMVILFMACEILYL